MLLSKGFEVEMYTGTPQGDIVGLSDKIVANLEGFVREPDSRNVEYTTAPLCNYDRLLCALVRPRRLLRNYLRQLGEYTLIPGSTLSLGDTENFYRSDPQNPYHTYIEQTYGTDVVTASIHINIGIADPEKLMQAIRLVRVEAPLYLAMSASSPFLGGEVTGYDSTRWYLFPKTPTFVPLFESHRHYIDWTEDQLQKGTMQNVRHLWSSVRPNGDRRPYNLNRLELRICDLMVNPIALLAVTALLEARLWQMLENPDLDPLQLSELPESHRAEELVAISDQNEIQAAHHSLDAQLRHWKDGSLISARDWIEQLYQEVWPTAKKHGFSCFLSPVKRLLREGCTAQQWVHLSQQGWETRSIIQQAIQEMEQQEQEFEDQICQPLVA
ncbi:Glutamate/cysteine ligase [Planktothrix serta PCC 8927]|uniref:Glutamate/cysteine ligase n=1 Tax=Planktothrix serta PCC 8927 TaxID=671068 RepID=A0A7Z9BIX9_9CYAN|nr:glutamate--cysteine ligase [Planktothrix serta]VXD15105.1 Glutamate/cysteine ligase [Planktothrix serta PCC 8927]